MQFPLWAKMLLRPKKQQGLKRDERLHFLRTQL